jgi:hypothetical protein
MSLDINWENKFFIEFEYSIIEWAQS